MRIVSRKVSSVAEGSKLGTGGESLSPSLFPGDQLHVTDMVSLLQQDIMLDIPGVAELAVQGVV